MKFYQGMQNKEIAQATGLSASSVGVMIHRALKQIRVYVEPSDPETPVTAQRRE